MAVLKNIGSARSPLNLGHGVWAYKRKGHWRYCGSETKPRVDSQFIEATDAELMLELEKRGFTVLCPAHECADRPKTQSSARARGQGNREVPAICLIGSWRQGVSRPLRGLRPEFA